MIYMKVKVRESSAPRGSACCENWPGLQHPVPVDREKGSELSLHEDW